MCVRMPKCIFVCVPMYIIYYLVIGSHFPLLPTWVTNLLDNHTYQKCGRLINNIAGNVPKHNIFDSHM